jgi:hypothetical protein
VSVYVLIMPSWPTVLLVTVFALHVTGCSSTPPPNAVLSGLPFEVQSDDQSPYDGRPVQSPESLAGLWETRDGHKGTIGIHLSLITTVPATATSLAGTVQSWHNLVVSVYERKGPTIALYDQNSFSDSPRGGSVTFDHGRLRLHSSAPPSIDLDLVQSGHRWIGRLHREAFDRQVTLRRLSLGKNASPLIGTWQTSPPFPFYTCAHVVQTGPDHFTGWFDSLGVFGLIHYPPNVKRLTTSIERYGELMEVRVLNDKVSFQLPAFADAGICCSHAFVGNLTEDGAAIRGLWPSGPNQGQHTGKWIRVRGDSCA